MIANLNSVKCECIFFPQKCTFAVLKYKSQAVLLWGKEVPELSKLQRTPASIN